MPHWFQGAVESMLRQLCDRHDIPLGVAVGWIDVESGGNMREVTALDERGFFQLSPEESAEIGAQHSVLSTDPGYSLEAGILLVEHHAKNVQRVMSEHSTEHDVVPASEFFWRLVKMSHSIGAGGLRIIFADAARAGATDSWESFSSYATANDAHYLHVLKHSPVKWLALVDRVFAVGAPWGLDRGERA